MKLTAISRSTSIKLTNLCWCYQQACYFVTRWLEKDTINLGVSLFVGKRAGAVRVRRLFMMLFVNVRPVGFANFFSSVKANGRSRFHSAKPFFTSNTLAAPAINTKKGNYSQIRSWQILTWKHQIIRGSRASYPKNVRLHS